MRAARAQELVAAANAELLQRFEAVGGEARRGNGKFPDALLWVGFERRVRRRPQPFRASKPRLERHIDG